MSQQKPRLIDMYCCAGGAGRGYQRAGFHVTGCDIRPQPRYAGDAFEQRSALDYTPEELRERFDAVHASPPCQKHTAMKTMHNAREHEDFIPQTQALLEASGLPWIMENVVGAPLKDPILLCGTMFGLGVDNADLLRHRLFQSSFPILFVPQCQHGARDTIGLYGGHVRNRRRSRSFGIYGEGCRDSRRKFDKGVPDFTVEQGRAAMEMPWATVAELSQAIPPAYTEWLGRELMAEVIASLTRAA